MTWENMLLCTGLSGKLMEVVTSYSDMLPFLMISLTRSDLVFHACGCAVRGPHYIRNANSSCIVTATTWPELPLSPFSKHWVQCQVSLPGAASTKVSVLRFEHIFQICRGRQESWSLRQPQIGSEGLGLGIWSGCDPF